MGKNETEELVLAYKEAATRKERDRIFEQLLESNYGMLVSLAKKTSRDKEKISFEELEQCAIIGFFNALKDFNPSRKAAKFTSYAYTVIKHYLQEEVRNSDLIPVSIYYRKKGAKILKKEGLDENISKYFF